MKSLLRGRAYRVAARAAAVAIVFLAAWAFWIEPSRLVVNRRDIPFRFTRAGTLRVAVVADLHVGSPFNGISRLRTLVATINDLHPDVICLLGDFVIQGVRGGRFVEPEAIAVELGSLSSPLGTFAVLGNHDAWLGHDRVELALRRQGITVVEERALPVETLEGRLWIAGVSDFWLGRHNVAAAMAAVSDTAPVLLLTHNPDVFPFVPRRVALTLAGHTHGGQVRLPFIGAPIVPSQYGQRYAAGNITEDARTMFVSTGIGTSILPVRFGVPPSIDLLTLSSR